MGAMSTNLWPYNLKCIFQFFFSFSYEHLHLIWSKYVKLWTSIICHSSAKPDLFVLYTYYTVILFYFFLLSPQAPPPPEQSWEEKPSSVSHLGAEDFREALKKKKHALVMFYAPCKLSASLMSWWCCTLLLSD